MLNVAGPEMGPSLAYSLYQPPNGLVPIDKHEKSLIEITCQPSHLFYFRKQNLSMPCTAAPALYNNIPAIVVHTKQCISRNALAVLSALHKIYGKFAVHVSIQPETRFDPEHNFAIK